MENLPTGPAVGGVPPADAAQLLATVVRVLHTTAHADTAYAAALDAVTRWFRPLSSYLLRSQPRDGTFSIQHLRARPGVVPPPPIGEALPLDPRMVRAFDQVPHGGVLQWTRNQPATDARFFHEAFGIESAVASRLTAADRDEVWLLAMDRPFAEGDWNTADVELFCAIADAFALRVDLEGVRRAMRHQTAVVRAVVDDHDDLAFTARADGTFEFASVSWTAITGMAPESCLSRGWLAAVHPDDLRACAQSWQAALDGAKGWRHRARLGDATGKGRWHWFDLRADPIRDDRGQLVKWYGRASAAADVAARAVSGHY